MITKSKSRLQQILLIPVLFISLFFYLCKSNGQEHNEKATTHKEASGHDNDDVKHTGEVKGHDNDNEKSEHNSDLEKNSEGEEDGTQFGLNETYSELKNGVKLILKYSKENNSFKGSIENTTDKTIKKVRVEVQFK